MSTRSTHPPVRCLQALYGFTLIELLVVVTIIVILLALLVPTMDRAIYQAELAVCMTRQRGIATGLLTYAVDYKRRYPYRPSASGGTGIKRTGIKPNNIYVGDPGDQPGGPYDDRATLKGYISINGLLNDPLAPAKVDFEYIITPTQIEVSYHLWFGWQYNATTGGMGGGGINVGGTTTRQRGMFKIGDRFEYNNGQRTYSFDFLASDVDTIGEDDPVVKAAVAGHQDFEGLMGQQVVQDSADPTNTANITFARWSTVLGVYQRGPIDVNFASSDGSVRRYNRVTWDEDVQPDPQMIRAPLWPTGYPFGAVDAFIGL